MNLITTIIGFGMSATFIVFVCTRLIYGRLRRMETQLMLENDLRIDLELPEHRITGLEPVAVNAIPTLKFNREAFSSFEDPQCTICLSEYQDKEVLRIMPKCGHSFHISCIDLWLRKHATCPVCRLSLQDSDEMKHVQTAAQSVDSPEASVEHSRQWLLPAVVHAEGGVSSQTPPDSISVDLDPVVSREAILTS
ncbi:Unknown protein [Striga hermonthica]|uniref:RING-type E3 ubiquitin transferase n=1 Tax=Striga hermonthica TaxID=68872 RepID=A0A9N7RH54_STRHE|nr:Unknown protein [Striga hermonthica]